MDFANELEHATMHSGCILRRLPYLRQIISPNQPLSGAPVRCLSRDIGQPTNFTHPELIKDGESQYIAIYKVMEDSDAKSIDGLLFL